MQNIQRVDPQQWRDYPVLCALYDDLPDKPYCSLAKGACFVEPKSHAITKNYIQPNHPAVTRWLWFDLDYANALTAYYDNNLPIPNVIIVNPDNGHAHVGYRIREGVGMTGQSRLAPINFLRAVYYSLRRALGADAGYVGNLIKNPFVGGMWHVYITSVTDYDLIDLADLYDLDAIPKTSDNDDIFGRNIALFDHTRHLAYPIAHEHSYKTLLAELLPIATAYNATYPIPLFDNEVYATCKSIARYCKSPKFANGNVSQAHREVQSMRGKIGGAKSKRKPSKTSAVTLKPWMELGISESTYYRDKKKDKRE